MSSITGKKLALSTAIVIVMQLSCRTRNSTSKPLTTSDMLTEFTYDLSGKIHVPKDKALARKFFEFDELGRLFDKIDPIQNTPPDLTEFMSKKGQRDLAFEDMYGRGFPASVQSVPFWVELQLKYTMQAMQKKGLSLSPLDAPQDVIKIATTDAFETYEYKIKVRVAKLLNRTDAERALGDHSPPLPEGAKIRVPLDVLGIYPATLGAPFAEALERVNQAQKPDDISQLLEAGKLLQATRLAASFEKVSKKSACIIFDLDVIFPYSFFYYSDFDVPECAADNLTTLELSKGIISHVGNTYPEFHMLFADQKVTTFMYFGIIDSKDRGYQIPVARELLERGFVIEQATLPGGRTIAKPEISDLDNANPVTIRMAKSVNQIAFEVTLAAAAGLTEMSESAGDELLARGLRDSEVVIYDGHAGYGRAGKAFSNPNSYPIRTYQIIFLNACWSYKYALSTVLGTKAARDLEFKNGYTDVLTTFKSASGYRHDAALLDNLMAAVPAYQSRDALKFKSEFTWYEIVRSINALQGSSGGIYAVSGEDDNFFRPDVADYGKLPVPDTTPDNKRWTNVQIQHALQDHFAHLAKDPNGLQNFVTYAMTLCGAQKLFFIPNEFFESQCSSIKNIKIDGPVKIAVSTPAIVVLAKRASFNGGKFSLVLDQEAVITRPYLYVPEPFKLLAGSDVVLSKDGSVEEFEPVILSGRPWIIDLSQFTQNPSPAQKTALQVSWFKATKDAAGKMTSYKLDILSAPGANRSISALFGLDPQSTTLNLPATRYAPSISLESSQDGKVELSVYSIFGKVEERLRPDAGTKIGLPEFNGLDVVKALSQSDTFYIHSNNVEVVLGTRNPSPEFVSNIGGKPVRLTYIILDKQGYVVAFRCVGSAGKVTVTETCAP